MKEFIERACLTNVRLSNVIGAHREALIKFLISSAAADGVEHNMTMNNKRFDPSVSGTTNSSKVATSSFYTEEGDELSGSIDSVLSLLLPPSDQSILSGRSSTSNTRRLKPSFPFGIIGLLSLVSPYVSSSVAAVPSATQCLQFLHAVAIHEDAFYALWETATATSVTTTKEEIGLLRPLQQQRQHQQRKHNTTSVLVEALPLESICVSTIFSVLPKVAHCLVFIHGYARQDIISSGVVTVMGRMAHFFGSSTRTSSISPETTTLLTPAHSEFVQLCLLSGQYQCAITLATSLTAILFQCTNPYDHSYENEIPVTSPQLIPLTVGHYLRYYYTLGNVYMLHDTKKYYKKALDMWNICITTPTTSSSSSSSSSSTPFHQRQPSATTPMSSDITSSKASSVIHPLQIAARKKHLLLSCLVACSHTSVVTTTTATTDPYLYYLPPMPLIKALHTKVTNEAHDMRSSRSQSISVTNGSYYRSTSSIEEELPMDVSRTQGPKQYNNVEFITTTPSTQQPNCDSTYLNQPPTTWPWSLPMYTSTCVYNAFFLDPYVHYTYYKQQQQQQQQQSSIKTTTDEISTNGKQILQQGSINSMLQELEQYNSLIAAYYFGDKSSFQQISETLKDLFRCDGTCDLILQLEESFTFRMIYTLANVYEAMPISMLVDYITVFDASTTADTLWKILEKAKECNDDFTFDIDQQHGFVHFFQKKTVEEQQDFTSSENCAVSEQRAAFVSLSERVKQLDISIATSKKYQAIIRSKEPTTGKKQATLSSGTTTIKPKMSAAR